MSFGAPGVGETSEGVPLRADPKTVSSRPTAGLALEEYLEQQVVRFPELDSSLCINGGLGCDLLPLLTTMPSLTGDGQRVHDFGVHCGRHSAADSCWLGLAWRCGAPELSGGRAEDYPSSHLAL